MKAGFGLRDDIPTVTMVEGCNFLTNEGMLEDIAMSWLDKVDSNNDGSIHIGEIKDHVATQWTGPIFYGQADEDTLVQRYLLSSELAERFFTFAGVTADQPISRTRFRSTVAALKDFDEDDLEAVSTTLGIDHGGFEEITFDQLKSYFNGVIVGVYQTGQGSKASKSRAKDVHAKFGGAILGWTVQWKLRAAAGQEFDSKEPIDQTDLIEGFVSTFGLPTTTAWQFYWALDSDESEAVEAYELDNAVIRFTRVFLSKK